MIHKRIRALGAALLAEHRSPTRVAAAIFVGAVVGCTPLFGFHILVCLALAFLLRLNKVIVYAAANLSIPPMIPIIGFASVQLGEKVRTGRFLAIDRALFHTVPAKTLAARFFWSWMVGGTLLGAAVGAVGGVLALLWLRRNVDLDDIARAIEVARRRYDAAPSNLKWYARMKYRMDPCYRAIAAHVPEGTFTVDLGTGLGMLPVLLGVMGQRRALGVEWDGAKARAGQGASEGLDVQIVEGDLREFAIPACDAITIVDVLHYYDSDAQRALLERCAAASPKILVREGDGARRGGSRWTRGIESLVTKLGWNRGPEVRFRPIEELEADLRALGYAVTRDEVAGRLHPGNVLLVATR